MSLGWDADDVVTSLRAVMRLTDLPRSADTYALIDLVRTWHRIDVQFRPVSASSAWFRDDGWWEIVIAEGLPARDKEYAILYHIGGCLMRGNDSYLENVQAVYSMDQRPGRLLTQMWTMQHEAQERFVLAWRLPQHVIGWADDESLMRLGHCSLVQLDERRKYVLAREAIFRSERFFRAYSRTLTATRSLYYKTVDAIPNPLFSTGIALFIAFASTGLVMTSGSPAWTTAAAQESWAAATRSIFLWGTAITATLFVQLFLLDYLKPIGRWRPHWAFTRRSLANWFQVSAGFTAASFILFVSLAWIPANPKRPAPAGVIRSPK